MTCLYYHWWDSTADPEPYQNLRAPILLSVATVRAFNREIPITVLDCTKSTKHHKVSHVSDEWTYFQKKLDFQVVDNKVALADRYQEVNGHMHLSKLFDVHRVSKDQPTILNDSDVFWLSNILPLTCDSTKFCFEGYNSGFFYYSPGAPLVEEMFELFKAYTITCLNSKEFWEIVAKRCGYKTWQDIVDEWVLSYLYQTRRYLFATIPKVDHVCTRDLGRINLQKMRMFHCNGLLVANKYPRNDLEARHSRGLVCLAFTELYNAITQSLSEDDLHLIFSQEQLEYYRTRQFSLKENIDLLLSTQTEDGHYHLEGCFSF